MRLLLLLAIPFFSMTSYGQNKKNIRKVTVILFSNQNPGSKVSVDTVMKGKQFDLAITKPDLFFCNKYFHLPYYVPTGGIFKTATKNKECDMKTYPNDVKCCQYDTKKRVIKMTVNGSGTMNEFSYKYNDKDQIISITDGGYDNYLLIYNSDGTISELRNKELLIEKRLVFIYN